MEGSEATGEGRWGRVGRKEAGQSSRARCSGCNAMVVQESAAIGGRASEGGGRPDRS